MGVINIKTIPPGPKAKKVVADTKRLLSPSIARNYPLVIESAHDCLVRDVDGNQYIDFNAGIAVLNVGSTNGAVVKAATEQLSKFTHYSYTDFYYEDIEELADRLSDIFPGDKKKARQVFYGNSGAEANEAAMKLARYHTKRPRFLAFSSAFHGRTLGTVSLTASKPVQVRGFSPLLSSVEHVPYPYCYRCPLKLEYPDCGFACIDFIQEQYFDKYVPLKRYFKRRSTNGAVVKAATEQLSKFTHYSYTDFYYEDIEELADRLSDIFPGDKKKAKQVFYGNFRSRS